MRRRRTTGAYNGWKFRHQGTDYVRRKEPRCMSPKIFRCKGTGRGRTQSTTFIRKMVIMSMLGCEHSEESKRKISRSLKGKKKSEEHKENLSISAKGRKGYWTGKTMPESARKAMSEGRQGMRFTEEHKNNISKALKGRTFSEETIEKLRNHKHTLETRLKMSLAKRGDKAPNWQGGISTENNRIRHSIEFKEWRKAVFVRDNFTCQKCGAKNSAGHPIIIHPHHIKSFAEYKELRFELSNGITLCSDCHAQEHKRKLL